MNPMTMPFSQPAVFAANALTAPTQIRDGKISDFLT